MDLIVAADKNWGIGKDGGLLCHLPEDLKYFKEKTMGSVIVYGRKTLESFPKGKPLPKRVNIVLTRDESFEKEGVTAVNGVEALFDELEKYKDMPVFVCGGAEIYRLLLPYCKRAYVTHIYKEFEADTFMPEIGEGWRKLGEDIHEDGGLEYGFAVYERI